MTKRNRDCEICRGAGFITLPTYPRLTVAGYSKCEPPSISQTYSKTFPCPECAGGVATTRVRQLEASAIVHDEEISPPLNSHVKDNLAQALAAHLLDERLISFEEAKRPSDYFGEQTQITARLAVVANDSLDHERERRRRSVEIAVLAMKSHAINAIEVWGRDFGYRSIEKDQAYRAIRLAASNVLGESDGDDPK